MEVKLIVMVGKTQGREIPLPSTQFIIGRGSACHLRPHSGLVSKYHCAIGRQAGHVVVRDLKSRNGTYVNDKPVKGTVRVNDSDVLTVGPLQFRFAIHSGASESPIQKVREADVRWLLEEDDESGYDMDSSVDTTVIQVPPHLLDPESEEAAPREGAAAQTATEQEPNLSDQGMKAGRYLREYLQPRRAEDGKNSSDTS